jgi:ATP-dependent DNA helicase RecG
MKQDNLKSELLDLVAGGESETVEFKETTGQIIPAMKTLCAFLNGHGGTLVFGVSRKGVLTGQIVADSTRKDLAAEFVKFEPGVEFPVEYVDVDETHQAIVVRVAAGKARPYMYDGRAYRRVQSTTGVMPQQRYESLLGERGGFRSPWESEPNEDLTIEALDLDLICETARMGVAYGRLDATADVTDPKRLLRKFGLMKNNRIFNGAAVLFGKDFIDYPQCYLRMARFAGVDKTEFLDSRNVQGNLFSPPVPMQKFKKLLIQHQKDIDKTDCTR